MEKRTFSQEEFTKVAPTFERGGVQFYLLRVDPQPIEEGKVIAIEEVYDHYPTEDDEKALYGAWLAIEKRVKVAAIVEYDKSENVNVFELNGMRAWLDKATRVGLVNSLNIEKEAGRTAHCTSMESRLCFQSPMLLRCSTHWNCMPLTAIVRRKRTRRPSMLRQSSKMLSTMTYPQAIRHTRNSRCKHYPRGLTITMSEGRLIAEWNNERE